MDIPIKRGQNNSERTRLIRENSSTYLSSSGHHTNYYGSTPTSLRIPNVNSITDLNEVEQAINSYNKEDDSTELPPIRKLSQFSQTNHKHRPFKNKNDHYAQDVNETCMFRLDSEASTSSNFNANSQFVISSNQTTTSLRPTRQLNNFVSSDSVYFKSNSHEDANSLYHFMRKQKKNLKVQLYESLDYDVNENMLYLTEKKRSLRSKQNSNRFCKFIRSVFPNQKESSRWFIIFLIGFFTALTACFIVVNVEHFSEKKYEHLVYLFDSYLSDNHGVSSYYNSTTQSNHSSNSNRTNIVNKSTFGQIFFKFQIPLLFWVLTNAAPTFLGSALVTYLASVAAGSGIPVIKCYLNGVKVPEVVRVKTYIAKVFGVIGIVVGGLCSGKEGPLIHSGAIIAAGLSQGKSTTLKQDLNVFKYFREDHEKRDFVSCGAAAGVASAFGAPVGGLLFSLEEGASFWNQLLTWRIFFCTLISTFTLNFFITTMNNKSIQMSISGLVNFGRFDNVSYNILEIPVFIFLGCMGGLIGALFNEINHRITIFRMKYLSSRPIKVFEAVFVAILTAFVGFILIMISSECQATDNLKKDNKIKHPLQLNCGEDEFSTMASLFISNAENVVINMFHLDAKYYSITTLSIFFFSYFFLSVITYGLSISSGIFIPALLIGSVFGRIIALSSHELLSNWTSATIDINELSIKYALIGAASVLGGIVRMTLSLTVILIETTGNLSLGLPLMICLIFAKWTGDSINEGLYDIHIKLQQIPFLHCEPHLNNKEIDEDETIFAQQIMSTPVITLNKIEKVRNIVMILQNETHYGFPVVDFTNYSQKSNNDQSPDLTANLNSCNFSVEECEEEEEINQLSADYMNLNQSRDDIMNCPNDDYISKMRVKRALGHYGKLRGFVLRWQLIVLLQKKIFNQYLESSQVDLNLDIFRDAYPRYDNIDKVIGQLKSEEMDYKIDLSSILNPSPYSVPYNCSFNRTFRLFRALGLRHLCVTDDSNNVIGIITRKDMSHFKVITHKKKRYIQKYSETIME